MAGPAILLVVRVHGTGGGARELAAALGRLATESAGQDGCVSFDVLDVPGDASEHVVLSAWRDEAAMRAHFSSSAYGLYVEQVSDLLTRPSDVVIHHIASTTHPVADLSAEPGRAD